MTKVDPRELFRMLSTSWQEAIDVEDWDAALLAGIGGYLYFSGQHNLQLRSGALGLAIAALKLKDLKQHEQGSNHCSFCGKSDSETRLGAGASAFICEDCVKMFGEQFATK